MALFPWAYEFRLHCGQRLLLEVDLSIFLLFYHIIIVLNHLFSKSISLQMKISNITPFQIGCTIVYVSIRHMCGGRDYLPQKFAIRRRVVRVCEKWRQTYKLVPKSLKIWDRKLWSTKYIKCWSSLWNLTFLINVPCSLIRTAYQWQETWPGQVRHLGQVGFPGQIKTKHLSKLPSLHP